MTQFTSAAVPAPLLGRWNYRSWAAAAAYIALYVLCDWLSYVQPVLKLGITPWNPQAGLTLIFLLTVGPQWLGCTALASFLAELLVRNASPTSLLVLAASVWIALGYGGLAALLRHWHLDHHHPIRTTAAAAKFAGACVGVTIVIAAGYVVLFVASGVLPPEHALRALPKLLIGDLTGVLTLTPLLVSTRPWGAAPSVWRQHHWQLLGQLAVLILSVWLIFGLPVTLQLRFFYLAFVPVIWISLRWGLPGGLLATLILQVGLIIAVQDETPSPLIDLQFLMLTLSLTALLLGAAVTERAGVLQRVAMREAEQRALLTMSPDGVLAIDAHGRVRMANPAALELFGAGGGLAAATSLREWLPDLTLQEPVGRATLQGRRTDGRNFTADIAWARLDPPANAGFMVTVRDATERLRLQGEARERDAGVARAMRFAVAGELASALAHELNQPITALVSYLRASDILAAPFSRENERLKTTLGKAAHEAMRASEVLRRLRDFYRTGTLKREPVHLPTVCGSVAVAFQDRLRRANASLVTHMGGPLPMPQADAMQLEIVLHNLLANALDAVCHSTKARRRIELHVGGDAEEVFLRIEDCGPGVAPDLAGKLFEPFVTNKPDGMGLGLAISRSFIRASGGELTFEPSGRLGGACFVVRIPTRGPAES
ncbi:MAG TPA: MASE1 domain-containing protein [Steroidobacteraceae bacterium]|nr:MASE1 domain-containing protein [Steroidobacteraceae bacterium]